MDRLVLSITVYFQSGILTTPRSGVLTTPRSGVLTPLFPCFILLYFQLYFMPIACMYNCQIVFLGFVLIGLPTGTDKPFLTRI